MEKDHRLFVRNLPVGIDDEKLQKLFEDHGKITNIDVKEKIQNDGSRIAFVNLTTTDRQLNTCFQAVNGKVVNGNAIRVEVAKESFLDRLKREREEAANRKEPTKESKVLPVQHIEKINIKAPANVKVKPTKRIYDFDELDNDESLAKCEPESGNGPNFDYDPALQVDQEDELPVVKQMKIRDKPVPRKSELIILKETEKKIISESEMKRLASVKQKRQAFRAKEQLISHALKAVDSGRNKKIVFSDDIDKIGEIRDKRSKSLFDDDGDEVEEDDWNDDKFKHDEKRSAKLAMSMNNLGRDKRFAIDERFLDDDENTANEKISEENDDNELKNEAQWQLGILQNVLGKPLKLRDDKVHSKNQKKMVRYDPTASDHHIHELEMKPKPAKKVKKAKLAASETKPEDEAPIPVSSEVFYSVSDNLADTLKVQEEFSLLKTFGTAAATDKNRSDDYDAAAYAKRDNWERNFDAKNPFKYESSDDEDPDPNFDQQTRTDDPTAENESNHRSVERNDSFFFASGDQRFCDAEEFFKTKTSDPENFNNVRRELKMIVRKKVRNNVKKSTPWRNKKIGRTPKAR